MESKQRFTRTAAALALLAGAALAQDTKQLLPFTDGAIEHNSIAGTWFDPVLGEVLVTGGIDPVTGNPVVLGTPVTGGPSQVLFAGDSGATAEMINNGVLYVGNIINDDVSQIVRILPGGAAETVTRGAGLKEFVGEALGGQFVVFLRTDTVDGQDVDRLWRTNDAAPISLLVPGTTDIGSAIITDDGATLYYTTAESQGGGQLFELKLPTGEPPRQLTSTPTYKQIARQMRALPPGAPLYYMEVNDEIDLFGIQQFDPATLISRPVIEVGPAPIIDVGYDREANTLYFSLGGIRTCVPIGPGPFDPTPQYGREDFFDYDFFSPLPGAGGPEPFVIGIDLITATSRVYRVVDAAPPPCPADLDGDGGLTIFDFLTFQNLFDAGDPKADFDGDGELTLFDFLAFQNAFDAGCP